MRKLSKPQLALLEKIYGSGPTPLGPINPRTYAKLDAEGFVQVVTLAGVTMLDLSAEGRYFMGDEPASPPDEDYPRRCLTAQVGHLGECLFCDADQGEACRGAE